MPAYHVRSQLLPDYHRGWQPTGDANGNQTKDRLQAGPPYLAL